MLNKHPAAERWNLELGVQAPNSTSLLSKKILCFTYISLYLHRLKNYQSWLAIRVWPTFCKWRIEVFYSIRTVAWLHCLIVLRRAAFVLLQFWLLPPFFDHVIIIIFSMMMITVMKNGWIGAFVPLQCQLLPCPNNYRSSTFNETQTTSNFNVSE